MPRKYNPEQKNCALKRLQQCEWTQEEYEEKEKSLYNKFRDAKNKNEMDFEDYGKFIEWYVKKITKQQGKCFYCGLEGDVRKNYRDQLEMLQMEYFREGNRGRCLEIERKEANQLYNKNCVLACYPCNNAKSDVFTPEEFIIIGAVIGALKEKGKLKKLKGNEFIQDLINAVKKATGREI